MVRINQLKMPLKHTRENIQKGILKELRIKETELISFSLFRESLDARKSEPFIVYTIDCDVSEEASVLKRCKGVVKTPNFQHVMPDKGQFVMNHRPVVVGFGPAGMFAAYVLAELGYRPIVLERGADVDTRSKLIDEYWATGNLNVDTNVQFGEGGAGTFSDGKLTTRIKDLRSRKVLEVLVKCGAPEEILYRNKPHIGTDLLLPTVKQLRENLIAMGAEIHFNTKVTQLKIVNGAIEGVQLADGQSVITEHVILAIGHSARDTFESLFNQGVHFTQKPFAVGVRIEHPQTLIDDTQYGDYKIPLLERYGAAEYQLTAETDSGRSVYTFCMCPGGFVVGAATEPETIVTNGMSKHARAAVNANSALLVNVNTSDFENEHPLAGMVFQRNLEKLGYELGNRSSKAPAMTVGQFLGLDSADGNSKRVQPSYEPGVVYTDLKSAMPEFMATALTEGLIKMGKKLKGFDHPNAIMTGFETRSSSPVRIVRDMDTLESTTISGLYPCGEGAGYAGGIMSSACDGIKVAEKIIQKGFVQVE